MDPDYIYNSDSPLDDSLTSVYTNGINYIYEINVNSLLQFTATIICDTQAFTITSFINFTQIIDSNFNIESDSDQIVFSQQISTTNVINLHINSHLYLTQSVEQGEFAAARCFVGFYQSITYGFSATTGTFNTDSGIIYGDFSDTLNFTQNIVIWKGLEVEHTLTFIQSIQLSVVTNIPVSDTLTFTQAPNGWIPDVNFVSNPTDPALVLSANNPPIRTMTLMSATKTITLRVPDWGDTEKTEFSRIMRRNRGGNLIVYRDPTWPASDALSYTFSGLEPNVISNLLDFIQSTIGQQIQWIDYLGRTWNGFLMTPAAEASEQIRNSFKISLDFQGSVVQQR